MIKIYYKTTKEKQVATFEHFKTNSWVHVEKPTSEDKKILIEEYGLDAGVLQDAADIHEVPRIEVEDGILYIFTRFAYGSNEMVDTTPMLIVVKNNCLITVTQEPFPRLPLFLNGKIDFSTIQRNILLFKLFLQINETYSLYLNSISKKLRTFSLRVEKIGNRDIIQFVNTENVLYDFNSALVRLHPIYNSFVTGRLIKLNENEHDLIEDVALASNQLIQITNENLRTVVNVREAYSTVMTNNLNRIIKLFTSLTVLLTIPTIIGTFYGMNVQLPFAQNPLAFPLIAISTLLVSTVAFIIFMRNDWL